MTNPYQAYYSQSYKDKIAFDKHVEEIKFVRAKLPEIPFLPKQKVLDVACGVSTFGKTFSNHVYGFDINPQAIKVAKKIGIHAKLGDVEKKWKYPDEYFDIVIASHIIEHVIYPDRFILEAKRVLKKGGLFIVLTPNLAAWFNRILLLLGFQPFFTEVSAVDKTLGLTFSRMFAVGRNPVGHLHIFTPGALRDIMEFYGFKIRKITGMEFGSFPRLLGLIDRMIAYIIPLAACIVAVAQKPIKTEIGDLCHTHVPALSMS